MSQMGACDSIASLFADGAACAQNMECHVPTRQTIKCHVQTRQTIQGYLTYKKMQPHRTLGTGLRR